MTEPELTEEELALLAEHDGDDQAEPELKPKKRAPRRKADVENADSTAVEPAQPAPVGDELPPVREPIFSPEPQPDPVEEALEEAEQAIAELGERNDRAAAALGYTPGPDHPHAPPAQMDFGDPWGQLPMQMRHDDDGRPAF